MPLEDSDSLAVTLRVAHTKTTDTMLIVLPIATPAYPNERLTVAPKYAVLDSATQARVDAEVEQGACGGTRRARNDTALERAIRRSASG